MTWASNHDSLGVFFTAAIGLGRTWAIWFAPFFFWVMKRPDVSTKVGPKSSVISVGAHNSTLISGWTNPSYPFKCRPSTRYSPCHSMKIIIGGRFCFVETSPLRQGLRCWVLTQRMGFKRFAFSPVGFSHGFLGCGWFFVSAPWVPALQMGMVILWNFYFQPFNWGSREVWRHIQDEATWSPGRYNVW